MELVKYDSDQRQRFPKNLVRLRKERGLSKSKLAQRLGWSYNTITSWGTWRTYAVPVRDRGYMRGLWCHGNGALGIAYKIANVCLLSKRQAHSHGDATRDCRSDQAKD